MTDPRQGTLNPLGVNCLRTLPGIGTVVFGARTLVAANPAFQQYRYVPVRRMALFLEQSLLQSLGWVIFEPNDVPLWVSIKTTIDNFMLGLFNQGAFQGTTAEPGIPGQLRRHDHHAGRPGERHRQHRRRLRPAEACRVRDHQDRPARRPDP